MIVVQVDEFVARLARHFVSVDVTHALYYNNTRLGRGYWLDKLQDQVRPVSSRNTMTLVRVGGVVNAKWTFAKVT